mmetsp:Transcript_17468/g.56553  ORF Transcript_17468/g.56553 Transcript_17468/m.56553 type:complete len:109 (-) Transcript_17468:207-533(-)
MSSIMHTTNMSQPNAIDVDAAAGSAPAHNLRVARGSRPINRKAGAHNGVNPTVAVVAAPAATGVGQKHEAIPTMEESSCCGCDCTDLLLRFALADCCLPAILPARGKT